MASAASRTAALVRAHRQLNHPHQRSSGGKFRRGHAIRSRMPRAVAPISIENDYANAIIAIMRAAKDALRPLLAALPELLDSARVSRGDAADQVIERRQVLGLDIAVEWLKGTERKLERGPTVTMAADYGFIDGVIGPDGEEVDVYLGPVADPAWVYVVHQNNAETGEYDEDKVMLGWSSPDDALDVYLDQYDDDVESPRIYGGMSVMSASDFVGSLEAEVGMLANRADSGESVAARRLLDRARAELDRRMSTQSLERLASQYANATTAHGREQLRKQAVAAMGINIATMDPHVPALVQHFLGENVALIKSLGNRTFDELGRMVTASFSNGTRHEELAKKIEERFGVGERHARLIARDQIGKLNGQVNASRQQELGVTAFVWRTMKDERVREEHQELEGEQFDYDDPPEEGLPGEPINCRCYAEPVFSTILEGLGPSSTDGEVEDDGEEARAAAAYIDDDTDFSGTDESDDGQDEAIAVTPKPGESPEAFKARMLRNEASRLQKAAARAQAKAQVAAIAARPSPPIVIAPVAPPIPNPPPPGPSLPPSSAPVTRAIATAPKPGETAAQHAARLARNEASRLQKAAARQAKKGGSPVAPGPIVAPPPPAPPAPVLPPPPTTTHIAAPVIAPTTPPIPPAAPARPATAAAAPRPGETPAQHAARLARNEASRLQKAAARAASRAAQGLPPAPTTAAPIAPPAAPAPTRVAPPIVPAPPPPVAPPPATRVESLGLSVRPARMEGAPRLQKPRELAAAFGNLGKENIPGARLSKPQQKAMREHLRASIEQYGMNRVDPNTKSSDSVGVKSNLRARGVHYSDGRMMIASEVASNAAKFARDQAAGIDYAAAIRRGDPMAAEYKVRANDYRTHIHEQVHGYGPRDIWSRSYSGVGVRVEEVTTEVSARKIVRDQLGLRHTDVPQLGRPETRYSPGSYSEHISRAEDAVHRAISDNFGVAIGGEAAYKHLEEASLRYKSLAVHPEAMTPEASAKLFAKSFDFDSIERSMGRRLSEDERSRLAAKIADRL